MTYKPVSLSEFTPESVALFIRQSVDLQLADVHTMLLLPRAQCGLEAGCNFAIAHVLLNIVSGISTILFEQDGKSGAIFKRLLTNWYWPHDPPDGLSPEDASDALYNEFRNSLIHALGMQVTLDRKTDVRTIERTKRVFKIKRISNLDNSSLAALEEHHMRPTAIGPTLRYTDEKTVLLVEGFYWGTRKMIGKLSEDATTMQRAARFLKPVIP